MGFDGGSISGPLIAAASTAVASKLLGKPQTTQVDPTRPSVGGLQDAFSTFLRGVMADPAGTSQAFTSDLQRTATGGIQQFLNQPAPEAQTFERLNPGLMDIFVSDGASLTNAMFPLFQRGLQEGLGSLASSGAGRFSTTFERQGIDLTQRALQDFNLLQQQAFQQNIGNRLGAAQLMGSLAGQAGAAPFERLLSAGNLGAQMSATNPALQLILGGLNFAQPQGRDTVVSDSPLDAALKGISVFKLLNPGATSSAPTFPELWGAGGT